MAETRALPDGRYFVLFTPVGWAVNDRETGSEYLLFGLGEEGYRLAKESADELNEAVDA